MTFKATQPKSTKITRKLTPAKPAKRCVTWVLLCYCHNLHFSFRDRSDDEYVDDEEYVLIFILVAFYLCLSSASLTKKNRQASPTPEPEVEEVVPKTKKYIMHSVV